MGACNSPVQNVTTVKLDNNSIVVLDEKKVTEKKTYPYVAVKLDYYDKQVVFEE